MGGVVGKRRLSTEEAERFITQKLISLLQDDLAVFSSCLKSEDRNTINAAIDLVIEYECQIVLHVVTQPNLGALRRFFSMRSGGIGGVLLQAGIVHSWKDFSVWDDFGSVDKVLHTASLYLWNGGIVNSELRGTPFSVHYAVDREKAALFWKEFTAKRITLWKQLLSNLEIR